MWKLKQFIPKETVGLEGRALDIGKIKVQVRKAIAEGGFSCVYLAVDALQPTKQYALKHMMCSDEESMNLVRKEINVMKILKGHQNIVTLVASDVFDTGRNTEAFVLMEFCDKSLVSILENRGSGYYDEKQILLIFRDICNAVYAMHCQSPPIAHRDLKAENLLLGSDGSWKLCDFGSTSTNHKCFDKPGEMGIEEDNIRKYTTPAYRSPEMWDLYRKEVISEKVDIWALGCLLYRICYFKSAFDGESKLQVLNGNYHIPELPKYSSSIKDMIKDMLQGSPNSRPDITQVWFRVNLLLPVQLQKETPDGPPKTTIPNMQMPPVNARYEGSTKGTPVSSASKSEHARKKSPQYANKEQQHKVSVSSSKTSGDGAPLGMFWATYHEEPISQVTPKPSQQSYVKRTSPPREPHPQKPLNKINSGNPLNKSYDTNEDFEIRFDSDSGSGKTRESHVENSKIRSSLSEKTPTFGNEAFNTFVADFDTTKLSTANGNNNSKSEKELLVEVDKLKEQLKQSNLEKTEINSKYEKLSSICRSQRQEIQELKQKVTKVRQSSPNKDNKRHQITGVSLPPSSQREKIEGSVLELQQEMFANVPLSSNPDQNSWQPFANEPKPLANQSTTKGSRPKSVRTTINRQGSGGPSSTGASTNGTWGFGKESFTAAPIPQGNTSHRYNNSEVKKSETASTKPVISTKPTTSAKPATSIKPTTSVKPATSTKPTASIRPAASTKPAGWAGF